MPKTYRYSPHQQRRGWFIVVLGAGFIALGAYTYLTGARELLDWLPLLGSIALGVFILVWGLDTALCRIRLEDSAFWQLGPVVRRRIPYADVERLEEVCGNAPQRVLRGYELVIRLKGRGQALAVYHVDDLMRYDELVSELEARTRLRVKRRAHRDSPTAA